MLINDETVKIKPDFVPETKLALKWVQLSDGNWVCTDRGSAEDTYDTEIRIYGREDAVNNIINIVENARSTYDNVLSLSGFNSQEHIFGADLNYANEIQATAFMQGRIQKTWKGFEVALKLSCLSPSFIGGNGSLPNLRHLEVGYEAESEYTIEKFDSYRRNFSYVDRSADAGKFTGSFYFTDQEMIQLRRYVAKQRGNTISIPNIFGVNYPFGRRSTVYPYYAKILEIVESGMVTDLLGDRPRWKTSITFAEVI